MSEWKLFWLKVYDSSENCFVVAKDARSAISIDVHECGYNFKDAVATYVATIPEEIVGVAASEKKDGPFKVSRMNRTVASFSPTRSRN
jgi:hypothetical protein